MSCWNASEEVSFRAETNVNLIRNPRDFRSSCGMCGNIVLRLYDTKAKVRLECDSTRADASTIKEQCQNSVREDGNSVLVKN